MCSAAVWGGGFAGKRQTDPEESTEEQTCHAAAEDFNRDGLLRGVADLTLGLGHTYLPVLAVFRDWLCFQGTRLSPSRFSRMCRSDRDRWMGRRDFCSAPVVEKFFSALWCRLQSHEGPRRTGGESQR